MKKEDANKREQSFVRLLDGIAKFIKIFVDPSKNIREEQQKSKENEDIYPLW